MPKFARLDKAPNYFTISSLQTGNDTTTVTTVNLPNASIPTQGSVTIIELIKINLSQMTAWTTIDVGDGWTVGLDTSTPTTTSTTTACAHPSCLWFYTVKPGSTMTSAVGGGFFESKLFDLTDGDGHGLLVATDVLNFFNMSTATGIANQWVAKVWYKWRRVTIEEYVGIVQSQL